MCFPGLKNDEFGCRLCQKKKKLLEVEILSLNIKQLKTLNKKRK